MAGESPPVTVAVVSWNTRELLLRCLDSLAGDARHGLADVWVVDNASSDGSAAAVRAHAPWAHVIEAGANLGFGAAVNVVASRMSADWLLIANADVALEPGALRGLLAAGLDRRLGCIAPRLSLEDGATEQSVHPFPTLGMTLAFNLGLAGCSARAAERWCLDGHWDPDRPRIVPWAIGACLLVRRSAFDAVGGFDRRHWLYAEDLDLAWRLHDRGWLSWYEPRARVLHSSGASARLAFGEERAARFMGETYALLERRRGSWYMHAVAAANIAGAALRLVWRSPDAGRWLRAHVRGLRAAVARGRGRRR